jgi:CheY-like chemotaxis protein
MVLCAVDDLMFSVKISTAAKQLGAEVYFERSAEKLLSSIRDKRPALVIFDLNSQRLRPMEAIAALKADPELKDIPTLGYVSHMDTPVIAAARRAGADEVMARSAFVEKLAEIVTRGSTR